MQKAPTTPFSSFSTMGAIHSAGDGLRPDTPSRAPHGRVEFPHMDIP